MLRVIKIFSLVLLVVVTLSASSYVKDSYEYRGIKIYKGSEVIVKDGNYYVTGWSIKRHVRMLYTSYNNRIKVAKIAKNTKYKVLEEKADKYETVWAKVMVKINKPKTSGYNGLFSTEAKLYKDRCGVCHGLHKPGSLQINHVPSTMYTMGPRAGLTPKQREYMIQYLQYATDRMNSKK